MAWLHTEIIDSVGPLEYILNTPSHHRVHHSRNPEYIDKNYGGMLIIWDRLLGTFKAEDKNNPPVYGLVHPVESFNPITVQFHPWPTIWSRLKRAKNLNDRLKVLFYGPGWRPGIGRLGNSNELPKIIYPVESYDPTISLWKKLYVLLHFGLLLFFYHELTLYQDRLRALVLNVGVLSLLASITSLGLMIDNERKFCGIIELSRCLLYFETRHHLMPIISHGLARTGLRNTHQIMVISSIHILFVVSTILVLVELISKFVANNLSIQSTRQTTHEKLVWYYAAMHKLDHIDNKKTTPWSLVKIVLSDVRHLLSSNMFHSTGLLKSIFKTQRAQDKYGENINETDTKSLYSVTDIFGNLHLVVRAQWIV